MPLNQVVIISVALMTGWPVSGVAYARYATPQCAAYARDKLHGFEYPIGSQLMVQLAEENMQPSTDPPQNYEG